MTATPSDNAAVISDCIEVMLTLDDLKVIKERLDLAESNAARHAEHIKRIRPQKYLAPLARINAALAKAEAGQ